MQCSQRFEILETIYFIIIIVSLDGILRIDVSDKSTQNMSLVE